MLNVLVKVKKNFAILLLDLYDLELECFQKVISSDIEVLKNIFAKFSPRVSLAWICIMSSTNRPWNHGS
jgi:hypothetical protein